MKSNRKKIGILLIFGLVFPLMINNISNYYSSQNKTLNNPNVSESYIENYVQIDAIATGVGAHNWTWAVSQPWCSGAGTLNDPYIIENLIINASTSPIGSGILITNSLDENFIVRNCTITNVNGASGHLNYAGGIKLINCSKGVIFNNTCADGGTYGCGILAYQGSYNINITRNIVRNNRRHGILAADLSYDLIIMNNNVTSTSYLGIYLYNGCHNNTIIGNNASGNADGIYLYSSDNNTIQGNIASDNRDEGIDLNRYCDNNRVLGNSVNNNPSEGIQVYSNSHFNIISGNNISQNNNGIRVARNSHNNTIQKNYVHNNFHAGIYLDPYPPEGPTYGCKDNKILNNTVWDNTEYGIYLELGCDNNTIRNNTVHRNELGIGLLESNYNNVTENTLKDNGWCIYEHNCIGNIIENNICTGSTLSEPIFINGTATGIGAHNWTWAESQPWCSGLGTWDNPYVIENLSISGFGLKTGIEIINSDIYFEIKNCTVNNSGTSTYDAGIKFVNVTNSVVFNNTCSNNGEDGILLMTGCTNNTIEDNIVNDNGYIGIHLYSDCHNNTILTNTASRNLDGILLEQNSDNNTIQGNTVNENSDEGIELYQNDDNNRILGNIVKNNVDEGIRVYLNSHSNKILHNNVSNNNNGIRLYNDCDGNTVSNNNASYNKQYGIFVSSASEDNNIINNTVCNNEDYGIFLNFCDRNIITENIVNDNLKFGIDLSNCDDSNVTHNKINRNHVGIVLSQSNYNNVSYNTLRDNNGCIFEISYFDNIIENNDCTGTTIDAPIYINGIASGVGAHNWTWAVSQPWCSGSGTWSDPYLIEDLSFDGFNTLPGILIENSDVYFIIQNCQITRSGDAIYLINVNNSRIIDNNCSNNGDSGIYLYDRCNNNTITGNILNNAEIGMCLYERCKNNIIIGNTANYNEEEGIYLDDDCNNNTVSENVVEYNYYGIRLGYDSINNSILSNTVENNDYGIFVGPICSFNKILGNSINNNNYGIVLAPALDFLEENEIAENVIYNNTLGINLEFDCRNTSIYKNFFLKNGKHAEDNGIDNHWNTTTIGNYWDNWTSPDTSPPDGFVDTPYNISGYAGSRDYLPIAEDGAPMVSITSPGDDDLFGTNAPNYDVVITDDYLDEMWYTLDGGLQNYTFTGFTGTIDQSAWDAMPDGIITLTFYASDTPENIGSDDVSIEKDTMGPVIVITSPSPGAEAGATAPAFIITVTDVHLDSIWYSLDGGVTTFDITTNATIDQAAWAALLEGSITITFYANDTLGNLSFEEVTITKAIPSGVADPTIIIVIVVVSIVGGAAIIAGVYIFMKKRAAPE